MVVVVSQWDRLGRLTEKLEEAGWREANPDRQESRDQRPLHPRRRAQAMARVLCGAQRRGICRGVLLGAQEEDYRAESLW
jgi:hypothetical protein